MYTKHASFRFLVGAALFFSARFVQADVLASNKAGFNTNGTFYLGQGFTTAAGVAENNIVFNFYSNAPATTPYAAGTGFLFSQAYTGTVDGLNSSDAGYLGQATAANDEYTFLPGLTLSPHTKYYFYENALLPRGTITGGTAYAGGDYFTATGGASAFVDTGSNGANFEVTGDPTPEPSNVAMLVGLSISSAGIVLRRRNKAHKAA